MTAITTSRAALLGTALALLLSAPGWAQSPPQSAAAGAPAGAFPTILGSPGLGSPGPVGAVTGQPEQDTFGYLVDEACTPRPILSSVPQAVGEVTGSPEHDTYGFLMVGETPCPPLGRAP